jgi:N-acetylglucosaminyldiphosphoundecaprenol N-acetyl-beta-D-mannosaminyltransferase
MTTVRPPTSPAHAGTPDPAAPQRAVVLGCAIDRLDMPQTLARCEDLIARREFAQHVAINAAKLVAMQHDPELRRIVGACELVSADGQAVVWASRLLGDPLPERVAGIDLMGELFSLAERRGFRVFILGAKADVLQKARQRIMERHPRLALVGMRDGYFTEAEEAEVAEQVREARPDILFVAISSPRKEYWLGQYGRTIDVPFIMGVGGAIDVVAGITQRAPGVFQRLGLEWLYRLAQEPRRLFRRYAVTNGQFAILLARAMGHQLLRKLTSRGAMGRLRQRYDDGRWMLMYPSLIALQLHRRSRRAHLAGRPDKAQLLRGIGRIITGIDISPAAEIGERFSISHGQGVVIGDAVIGDDCRILQGVTIGRDGFEDHTDTPSAYPRIGDRVTIYAGAVLVGGVTIGHDAVIAANAVVVDDVAPGVVVGGVPARVIGESPAAGS